MRACEQDHLIERVGAELRKMMPFLDPVTVRPGEGPISAKAASENGREEPGRRRLAELELQHASDEVFDEGLVGGVAVRHPVAGSRSRSTTTR